MNERQREKIRKCLELSKSANENEAAAALSMAQSLMCKYGMANEDIELISMGKTTSNEKVQVKPVRYVSILINVIKRAFGVDVVQLRVTGASKAQWIGVRERAEIAAYSFDVVYRLVKKARTEYIKANTDRRFLRKSKVAIGDEFALGFVSGISIKLPTYEQAESETTLIERYIDQEFGELVSAGVREREAKRAYQHHEAGRDEGAKANIAVGVNGTSQEQLFLE